MDTMLLWNIGQFVGLLIAGRIIFVQGRDNKTNLDNHMKETYSKAETDKIIDLKLKPLEVLIAHVNSNVDEVKALVKKALCNGKK